GGRRADRGARGRDREARSDADDVLGHRSGPAATPQMRVRRPRPAQSRQGVSGPAPLRRARPHACAGRQAAVSGPSAVLIDTMTDTLKARDAKDVENVVHWALSEGKALEILGHGSKRAIGRPPQTELTLDLSALSGVTLYEPEELVLSAKAGTPLSEI